MISLAALVDGQAFLLADIQRGGAALGADLTVAGVVARAVEEHPHTQGDALPGWRLPFFLFLLFFEAQGRGIARLLLPGTGLGYTGGLRQARRGREQDLRGSADGHGGRRGKGGGRVAMANDHRAGAADDHAAMAAGTAPP